MDNQTESHVQLKKINHILQGIALTLMGGLVGIVLVLVGYRFELGGDWEHAKSFYVSGVLVIILSIFGTLVQLQKSDKTTS